MGHRRFGGRWYSLEGGGAASSVVSGEADGLAVDAVVPEGGMAVDGDADAGMSTVEYAVGTVAAAAFAAVLYKIVTGDSIVSGLTDLVNSALQTAF